MGGLTCAAVLERQGFDVRVYEQARKFSRIGAGIQQSANSVRVLRSLGLEQRLRSVAFQPAAWTNREWDSGKMKYELPLGAVFETRYGAPYLLMHRGDLHAALASVVPPEAIHMGKQLTGLDQTPSGVVLRFADGSGEEADAVIGADGVHSKVRELLLATPEPIER